MTYYMDDEDVPEEEMVMVEIPKRCLMGHIPQEATEAIERVQEECRRGLYQQEQHYKRTIEQLQRVHVTDMEQINQREKWHLKEIEWYRENAPVKYHLL